MTDHHNIPIPFGDPIPVFYDRRQSVATKSFSPSSRKPALVVQDWEAEFGDDIEVNAFTPATRADLCLAHDPDYVDGVLTCEIENGFGNHDPAVAATLRYTVGSMVAAARSAVQRRYTACSPTSGFHHAHHAHGEGYCTFNGLLVAALKLKQLGLVDRVAIVDLDQHYGNGTQDIIDRLGLDWVYHLGHGRGLSHSVADISSLSFTLKKLVVGNRCDLVLYQAGADAHIDDPLGGYLTTPQLSVRDRTVFRLFAMYSVPVAWNLAGGYQQDKRGGIGKVLDIHRNTMAACINYWRHDADSQPA